MSEYQYYEFQAVDRLLTRDEQAELRAISTRARITAASFTNTYNYGDIKRNPMGMLQKHFDALVYVANWGSRQLAFRFPAQLVKVADVSCYAGDCLTIEEPEPYVILTFSAGEVGGDDWIEGEGWMGALIALRSAILKGDLRCLYLGWLLSLQRGDVDEDAGSPPVPPGLSELSGPLGAFVELFDIDANLIRVPCCHSPVISGRSAGLINLSPKVRAAAGTRYQPRQGPTRETCG